MNSTVAARPRPLFDRFKTLGSALATLGGLVTYLATLGVLNANQVDATNALIAIVPTVVTVLGTTVWATREDARRAVFAYLGYYNHNRLHSTLDYRTPHEARVGYCQDLAPVA